MITLKDILNEARWRKGQTITIIDKGGEKPWPELTGVVEFASPLVLRITKSSQPKIWKVGEKHVTFGRNVKSVKIHEGKLTESRMLSVFDFDDTLAKSDSWIYVMKNGKEVDKLDPAEFAMHRGLKKGEEYDFKDFDKPIQNPRLIKKNVDLLRKQLKKGGRKVTILTARRLGAPISHFFRTIGINPYVVPLGSGNPQDKADYIEKEIQKGYDPIYFMDDSPKNIKAIDALKKKYPSVTLITSLVK